MDEFPQRGWSYIALLSFFLVLTSVLSTVFNSYPTPEKKISYKAKTSKTQTSKKKEVAASIKEIETNKADEVSSDTTESLIDKVGPEETTAAFEARMKNRADSIRATLTEGKRRTDVIIRYYPHLPDGKLIYTLNDLGYYLHKRPTDPAQLDMPTNALFYGDNVPLLDIQMVALELVNKGVEIRQIKLSKFHADWKANALEIGTDADAKNSPILSAESIRSFRK